MHSAPSAAKGTLAAETISKKNKDADDEIERMLAQLKSWKWKLCINEQYSYIIYYIVCENDNSCSLLVYSVEEMCTNIKIILVIIMSTVCDEIWNVLSNLT